MVNWKKGFAVGASVMIVFTLSACGIDYGKIGQELGVMKPTTDDAKPVDTKATDTKKPVDDKKPGDEKQKSSRELYLLDGKGYVVPQSLNLPQTVSTAKQALEYLVAEGPVTNILPNGFKAVLPVGTVVKGIDIGKDNVAVVDFSPEFKKYKAEDEQKILQAITWTVTQFDNIQKVKIRIDGVDQTTMPVGKTPISDGLTRADGINFDMGDTVDIRNTKPVVLYFISQNTKSTYYVPVTRRVAMGDTESVKTVINELIKGPGAASDLITDLNSDVKLLDMTYADGKVTLNFNANILGNSTKNTISNYSLEEIVLSLTEQTGVKSVSIQVNGKSDVLNDKGEKLTKPVLRPENVNTGNF